MTTGAPLAQDRLWSRPRRATPIRTGAEYVESLRGRGLRVFLMGEPVPEPVDHPIIRPSINAVARTYDLAVEDPELARLAQDLAGGLVATLPSQKDFESPVTGPLLRKFLKGRSGVATEARVRILRLIENMTMGRNAVGYLTESMHGAGSPQAQRIQIERGLDLEGKKKLARDLAGIEDPEPPPSARRS